jgi:hypothetical protein
MSEEDISDAVLVILEDRYSLPWCNEVNPCNQETIKEGRHQIACVREWLKTQRDPRLVGQYLKWLDHYEREYGDAQRELQSRARQKDQISWEEKNAREWRKAANNADKLPVPTGCKP